jgi:hypothetical protein
LTIGHVTKLQITTRALRGPDGSIATALLEANARRVLDHGVEGLVLDEDFTLPEWDAVKRYFPAESVRAAFAFAPLPRPTPLGKQPPPSLVSHDAEEISVARQRLTRQVEFLGSNGIARLLVPAAEISAPSRAEVRRQLGTAEIAGLPRVIDQLHRRRDGSEAVPHELDNLMRVLDAVLEVADRHAVEVALMPAAFPSELPIASELLTILAEFHGAPLTVWANTLDFERALFCQIDGASTFLDTFRDRLTGALIEDGHLLRGKLPVGQGSVGFERWRPVCHGETVQSWTLDLPEGASGEDLEAGLELVANLSFPALAAADPNPSPFLDKSLRDLV